MIINIPSYGQLPHEPLWGRIMIKFSHLLLTLSSAVNILIYSYKVIWFNSIFQFNFNVIDYRCYRCYHCYSCYHYVDSTIVRISSSAQFCVVSPQVFGREVISLIWTIKMMMTTTTMMMMMMMMPTRWRSRGCEAQQQQPWGKPSQGGWAWWSKFE